MISSETVFSALLVVAILMVMLSVPSIFMSLSISSKRFKRFTALRSLKDEDPKNIPPVALNDWNAIRNDMGYITLLTEEIEKMAALRPMLFNAEMAAVLICFLIIVPGFEFEIFIFMAMLLSLCVISVLYGHVMVRRFGKEYVLTLQKMSEDSESYNDLMYG